MASPHVARVTLTGDGLSGSLRPYQAEAVTAIAAGLRDGGRRQLRAACGTGKTHIASKAAAGLLAGRGGVVAVLVPSIALAAQTITAWQAGCPADRVLAVCSDYTVGGGGVRAADLAIPVTTDAEVIARWLADTSGQALIAGTYDSAHRLAEGLRRAGQVAGLVVCDEGHRLTGAAGKTTAAILAPGFMPGRRRLYMTATPRIGTGVSAGGTLLVTSMDDEQVFGPVAYAYPFSRGIAEGWLKGSRAAANAVLTAVCEYLKSGAVHGWVPLAAVPVLSEPKFLRHLPPGYDPGESGQFRTVSARAFRFAVAEEGYGRPAARVGLNLWVCPDVDRFGWPVAAAGGEGGMRPQVKILAIAGALLTGILGVPASASAATAPPVMDTSTFACSNGVCEVGPGNAGMPFAAGPNVTGDVHRVRDRERQGPGLVIMARPGMTTGMMT